MIRDIQSTQSWKMFSELESCALIDVRTEEEWKFTGVPSLESINKKVIFIPWRFYPAMSPNQNFMVKVKDLFPDKNIHLFFICRSGSRSCEAASAAAKGSYTNCYNISDGFEGNLDNHHHRNNVDGWKLHNLPWIQS